MAVAVTAESGHGRHQQAERNGPQGDAVGAAGKPGARGRLAAHARGRAGTAVPARHCLALRATGDVEFKRDRGRELAAFRLHIEESLIDIGSVSDYEAREDKARIVAARLANERDELEAAMKRRRWPGIVFGAVAGVLGAAAPLAGHDVTAIPAVVSAVYSAIGTVRGQPSTSGKPLAYAALAQARFQA